MKDPIDLLQPLWTGNGHHTVALRTDELQAVFLQYGVELHMRNGVGHYLRHKRIAPGIYSVWLEVAP